jgi:hypothetical protein
MCARVCVCVYARDEDMLVDARIGLTESQIEVHCERHKQYIHAYHHPEKYLGFVCVCVCV